VQKIKKNISPSGITRSWQTILVDEIASFKVPSEWVVEQEDGIIYVTDVPREFGEYDIYILGIVRGGIINEDVNYTYPHELLDGWEMGHSVRGIGFSNSSMVNCYEYYVNGEVVEYYVISRFTLSFLVLNNDVVTYDIMEDIAKTFK
jgi:hypothetical protein